MNRSGLLAGTFVAVALIMSALACSSGPRGEQPNLTGQHPSGWLDQHWIAFNQNKTSCVPCHGSYTDLRSTGGTTGINCFTCHGQYSPAINAPQHPAGWQTVGNSPFHGTVAKQAPTFTGGFSHCAACHGTGFDNADGNTVSCMACHTQAPHPDGPWHGTTATMTNHATANPDNAAECAKCHTNGANSSVPLLIKASAGTAPGCFNNTLCHGNVAGHTASWLNPAQQVDPTLHGRLGAMLAPSETTGFAACQACHGADWASGPYSPCFSCHQQGAPHPAKPWSSSTLNHGVTDQGNAPVCYSCHANGKNSDLQPSAPPAAGAQPGCFNNTMCHSKIVP